jgi:hypothetical protein
MSSPRCAVSDGYRRGWALGWCLCSSIGVLLATVEWSMPVVVAGLLLDSVLVAVALAGLHALLGPTGDPSRPDLVRMFRLASAGVSGLVSVAAATVVSSGLGAALALIAAASAPPVLERLLPLLPGAENDHGADGQDRVHV